MLLFFYRTKSEPNHIYAVGLYIDIINRKKPAHVIFSLTSDKGYESPPRSFIEKEKKM